MNAVEIKARAKINLSLDVTSKRPDGYHEVSMIMQTIELHDDVVIEKTESGIEVSCNSHWVPSDSRNIAYKAANLLMERFAIHSGVKITINKKIPVAAGMAGGSSNAAAVLKGMNELFSLSIEPSKLMQLGKEIGADVPFCIKGGTMLAEGIGEILTELPSLTNVPLVLVKPKIGVSTAWVYKNLILQNIKSRPDTQLLISALENNQINVLAKEMKNVLETVTIPMYNIVSEIKNLLLKKGALGSMMSGSGPTVFGIFKDKKSAEAAYHSLKSRKWNCYLTKTLCEEK